MKRRTFIETISKTTGSIALFSIPGLTLAKGLHDGSAVTVGGIMDKFISQVPGAPFTQTVDTLKSGSRDTIVTGVVTTMFATVEVIRKTIAAGANFIIAHEPTFYNHTDDVDWLQQDDVYTYKAQLLHDNNITVWRNHDYIHSLKADGVYNGVLDKLEWKQYDTGNNVLKIKSMKLKEIISHAKTKLDIKEARYMGDLDRLCEKILLMPGAAGGMRQIGSISRSRPDVLMCGEVHEWETAEYIRDARTEGMQVSLVVLGHIASEEPGSIFMANWLKSNISGITATHIPSGNSLQFA
jgi:putative NIF3 family GTP cyclohydrolase 1 type 2